MDGNNRNFNYFLIKFNNFDQINIGRVTLIYFIEFSIKSISQQPITSYNTSIIEPISMDSPPNDKWGFWYLIGRFVGWYWLYSTNLVCLANERFWYLYGWNPYL